jgi:hypothetical protein
MEYIGHAPNGSYDQVVVRGDFGTREFVASWPDHGRIIAAMNVNVGNVVDQITPLITAGTRLADPDVPYDAL